MKRISSTFLFLFLFTILAFSQKEETLLNGGGIRLTGLWTGWNSNFSSLGDNTDFGGGGFFHFEINNDYLIGWGGVETEFRLDDGRNGELDNNTITLGYTHNSDRAFHPVGYLRVGGGDLTIDESNIDEKVFIIQPTIGAELNITRWFRLGAEIGYQRVSGIDTPGIRSSDLSSFIAGLKFKIGWSWGKRQTKYEEF